MRIRILHNLFRGFSHLTPGVKTGVIAVAGVAAGAGVVGASMAPFMGSVASNTNVFGSTEYHVKFNDKSDPDGSKRRYIADLQHAVKAKLDEYERSHPDFETLPLKYITFTLNPSAEQLVYYEEITKAIKAIDPRLEFELQPATDENVDIGYYDKNNPMVNFLWQPDYNAVGTWLAYMFQEDYQIANLWPATWQEMQKQKAYSEGSPLFKPWAKSMYEYFLETPITITPVQKEGQEAKPAIEVNLATTDPAKFPTMGLDSYSLYANVQNLVGAWVSKNSDVIGDGTTGEYDLGFEWFSWANQLNVNIPHNELVRGSQSPRVVRPGLVWPDNENRNFDYTDIYTTTDIKEVTWASAADVQQAKSANVYNPTLTDAPIDGFFQPALSTLMTWAMEGNLDPDAGTEASNYLVPTGSTTRPGENFQEDEKGKYLEFTIRPTEWYKSDGNGGIEGTGQFLSPADFHAGFAGYWRGAYTRYNANSYFTSMLSLDLDTTLAYAPNKVKYKSNTEELKPFRVYFENPLLSVQDTLDILSKEYYAALPSHLESVQNIVDTQKWDSLDIVGKDDKGNIQLKKDSENLWQLYGFANATNLTDKAENEWQSAGPYVVTTATENTLEWAKNPSYGAQMDAIYNKGQGDMHYSGLASERTIDGETRKAINKAKTIWGDTRTQDALLTVYDNDGIDVASVPTSKVQEWINTPDYQPVVTKKNSMANIVPFNLLVYQTDSSTHEWFDANGEVITDVHTDQYGNYVFPTKQPVIKAGDRISQAYVDLIVKDFYTPFNPATPSTSGVSATIRTAIIDMLNWYDLSQIIYGTSATVGYQMSFVPYGNYSVDGTGKTASDFWEIAANAANGEAKFDPTSKERNIALTTWTYDELKTI